MIIPFIKNINFFELAKFISLQKKSTLPKEYIQIEYLGTEFVGEKFPYIVLDWRPTGKCGFETRCSQSGRGTIFGKFNWSWQNYLALSAGYIDYNERYQFYYSSSENWVPGALVNTGAHNISLSTGGLFTFDSNTHQFTPVNQSGDWNMFLFLANNGSGTPIGYGTYNANTVFFYYFKGYELDETTGKNILKCDLIPVKRVADNKPGMYDFVTGKFYTSAEPGVEFKYVGPVVSTRG